MTSAHFPDSGADDKDLMIVHFRNHFLHQCRRGRFHVKDEIVETTRVVFFTIKIIAQANGDVDLCDTATNARAVNHLNKWG